MTKKAAVLCLSILIIMSMGCAANQEPGTNTASDNYYPITITDSMGREVTINERPERLVSGYYISTYMFINLGLKGDIVGIESKANTRPVYKLFAPELLEIADVGTAKAINIETVLSLEPDLVILPYQQAETADKLEELGIPAIVIRPETLDDFIYAMEITGEATQTSQRVDTLKAWFNNAWNGLENKTGGLELKKVYMCSSSDPLNALTAKMYQAEMIKAAGGEMVTNDLEGSYWTKISMEHLYSYDPEFMFISSGGEITPGSLLSDPVWSDIFNGNNVYTMPSGIEGWDNPTLSSVLGAYYIANKLHPEAVSLEEIEGLAIEFYRLAYDTDVTAEQLNLK